VAASTVVGRSGARSRSSAHRAVSEAGGLIGVADLARL
jgi:hypothetical protein